MNYHNITKCDMKNGDGLRVVLWVSGCEHHCDGCQNPQTWDPDSGIPFDEEAEKELFEALDHDYISGITFSGGDPLHPNNIHTVLRLARKAKKEYKKTVWVYTGYTLEELFDKIDNGTSHSLIHLVDVFVDGKYEKDKRDVNYPWAGSTNQRVINMSDMLAITDWMADGFRNLDKVKEYKGIVCEQPAVSCTLNHQLRNLDPDVKYPHTIFNL